MIVAEVPSAPSAPVMDSSTLKSISVAWSPPSDNGGSSITGYKIYMNDFFSDKLNLVYDGSFTPSVFSYTQQNLIQGQPYRFKVSAINRVGEGSVSSSGTFYSAETPGAPSAQILISSTSTSVAFSWTPPIDDGDSVITGYEIWSKRITDPESGWALLASTDLNTLQYTHNGLTGTADIQYKIRATSTLRGTGGFSPISTFILSSVPTMSSAPTIESINRNSITLSWTVTNTGGSPILRFLLYRYNKATRGNVLVYDGSNNAVVVTFTDTGLYPGIEYGYKVVAINRVGASDLSPESVASPGALPIKPQSPTFVTSNSTSITYSFKPFVDSGGLPIVRYHLYRDQGTLTSSFTEIASYLGSDMQFTVTQANEASMVPETKYRFYFTAENTLGEGPASGVVMNALGSPPNAPSAPTLNRASCTPTSLYIKWSALATQDITIDGFGLYMSEATTNSDFKLIFDGYAQPET